MSKKKIKGKQNGKSGRRASKNSRLPSKNSKLLSTVNSKLSSSKNPIQNSENPKSLPKSHKSMPVNPSPKSTELIDPAIIFTPEQKKDNSINLVSVFKINYFIKHTFC